MLSWERITLKASVKRKRIHSADERLPASGQRRMASEIYDLIKMQAWAACLEALPTASREQVQYKNEVSSFVGPLRQYAECEIDTIIKDGYTPLHAACLHKAPTEVIRLLIEKSADANALAYVSALFVEDGNQRLIDNAENKSQRTPLHIACLFVAPIEVIRLLIEKGANLNAVDYVSAHVVGDGNQRLTDDAE
jgi:hypothetical protein